MEKYRLGSPLGISSEEATRNRQLASGLPYFHEAIPDAFIAQAFEVKAQAHWHTFQILTKRAPRLAALAPHLPWPPNVWQGVSVENTQYTEGITSLRDVPAAVRFLSLEPLLGPIEALPLEGIHWVIVGGESGP